MRGELRDRNRLEKNFGCAQYLVLKTNMLGVFYTVWPVNRIRLRRAIAYATKKFSSMLPCAR